MSENSLRVVKTEIKLHTFKEDQISYFNLSAWQSEKDLNQGHLKNILQEEKPPCYISYRVLISKEG